VPPTRCPLETIAIGRAAQNVGITGLSVRSLDGLGTYDVHVAVASTFDETRKVDVTLATAGAIVDVVDVVRLEVPPNGDAERTVRVTIGDPAAGMLSATLAAQAGTTAPIDDALALDDRAEIGLTATGPVSVLLITDRPASLVAEALRLHPRVDLSIAAPTHVPTTTHDLIVLESKTALALPPARHLVGLGVEVGNSPIRLTEIPANRTITRWDFDAPWFRYVDLRDVVIGKARRVEGGRSVVDSDNGPLAATVTWDGREVLVTGFAIDETDLTLRAAFPNVIANLVDWAAPATSAQPARGVLATAESHVKPKSLPKSTSSASSYDAPWFARLAVLLALLLLCIEQAYYARRVA
jgi:hypothetical protein